MKHLIGGISSGGRALPEIDGQAFNVARSNGPWLWDSKGVRYVDTAMGFGATMLGHAQVEVMEAASAAMLNGPMPSFAHADEEAAAAALATFTGDLSQVIFLNTGSEAVHLACRTARVATGRQRIVKFAAGYDGWYDSVAFGNAGQASALMSGTTRAERDGMLLLRYNDFEDAEQLFRDYSDIAALVVEPVLANAGCIEPAPGYLKHLSDLAHRNGALVILDEVLMGLRLCPGLTGTLLGAEPDLATVGKAIGSGIPVAALVGKPEYMRLFEQGKIVRAGTYSGAPPACAAVLATLKQLATANYAALLTRGDQLRAQVVAAFASKGMAVSSTGYGSVFTLWPSATPPRTYADAAHVADSAWTLSLHKALRRERVMSMPFAFGRTYLTFAHQEKALQAVLEGYKAAIASL
ncbi:aminotransferase class III-fold pyridoxal phosphate-dependent enzyme [Pseudomonas amygdali]|uniref:aminotransferase class III-fold pyridoxal phosphate-dependent enzyme n=1 Tax=Pseudomonas amygdali TaxID=47877 RepID=UPI0005C8F8A1|nr:aminotransferase class III-fold pyridoxal phosphate-dependent enzyme [Pseudomonas amygdali]